MSEQEEQLPLIGRTLKEGRQAALRVLAMTGPSYEELVEVARREWPHMPVQLAVSYAEEYLAYRRATLALHPFHTVMRDPGSVGWSRSVTSSPSSRQRPAAWCSSMRSGLRPALRQRWRTVGWSSVTHAILPAVPGSTG